MFKDKKVQFLKYLDDTIQAADKEEKELLLDERKDDAQHVKVKTNIYNVFKTTFQAVLKNRTEEEFIALYINKMNTIPANWKTSYENAKAHNDTEKMLIEEIKLQTLDEIRTKFFEIWEDADDRDKCNKTI